MNDREFNALADETLRRIEASLDQSGADLDYAMISAGVFEIEFPSGAKVIVNQHAAAQEIWVAAPSGGFHFRRDGDVWRDTRTGRALMAELTRLVSALAGEKVDFGEN